MRLKDKVAVITGAAQGIGLACAERFKAEGAKLMLSDINEAGGKAAADHLGAPFIRCDAGLKPDVEALIGRAVEIHGRVDIMMSNAGITHAAEFLDLAEEDFDRVIRTNMKSVFLCGQAAARQMVRQGGGGVIISMSSVNALLAIPNQVAYGMILSRTPIGRCGEASEVASVAAFLASEDASYITGQIIYPDGGRMGLNYTMPVAG